MADEQLGPVEIAVIAFPDNQFNGRVAPALADLVSSGTVTLLDLVFVTKDEDGSITGIELDQIDAEVAASFDQVPGEVLGMLSDEDFESIGAALEPNSSALAVVWENTWARSFATAVLDSGGVLVAHDRIDAGTVAAALADIRDSED